MTQQLPLDLQIDQAHAAIERAEADALAVIERLQRIPGTEGVLSRKRSYGEIPNPWAGEGNMTAQAAVLRADRGFAAWLANRAGKAISAPDYEAQAAQERLHASARSLEAQTAAMRARNEAGRRERERAATYGTWNPILGKVI